MKRVIPLLMILAVLIVAAPSVAKQDPGAAIERQYRVVTDPALNKRLNEVGGRILTAARLQYPKFSKGTLSFKIIRNTDLNAMSLPDGRIYITSGMMSALANRPDDELAALLGHEATHVTERHASNQNKQTIIGIIIGGLLGKAVGGSADTGARVGGSLLGASYSRDDEYRADAGGVRLLARAGYDPYAMGRLLQILKDKYGGGSAKTPVVGWFASHPDTGKRVENANRVADQASGRRQ